MTDSSLFRQQIRFVLKRISDNKKNLVPDTQNTDQNSGQTFEGLVLDYLIFEFALIEVKNLTTSQKKKIHPKATPKCRVFRGACKDGKTVYVLDLPKSTPDFIVVHPDEIKFIECKSIFSVSKTPKFNAGLNDPEKVRMTIYLTYKAKDNVIVIRHGEQIITEEEAEAVQEFADEMDAFENALWKRLRAKLGRVKPEYAKRFEHLDVDLWKYSESLEEKALNLFDK